MEGIQETVRTYMNSIKNVKLHGPTYIHQIIEYCKCMSQSFHLKQEEQSESMKAHDEYQKYHILLILTDGALTDFKVTTDSIVESSHLPLSIIIIGVGDANFNLME